ncbi:MAG: hypothetical protein QMD11_09125 [Smithella sp.]|nr:hypothetical protein [Smithella sp.]
MKEFLEQIRETLDSGQFYLALFCCLALPDICGAISSEDGLASGSKYKAWFDRYVSPKYNGNLDGSNCYAFRCAALHQGRAEHNNLGYRRILFIDPVSSPEIQMHNNILNDALNLDVRLFCADILESVQQWIKESSNNEVFKRNYSVFLQRHEGGLPPYISGVDVFS